MVSPPWDTTVIVLVRPATSHRVGSVMNGLAIVAWWFLPPHSVSAIERDADVGGDAEDAAVFGTSSVIEFRPASGTRTRIADCR